MRALPLLACSLAALPLIACAADGRRPPDARRAAGGADRTEAESAALDRALAGLTPGKPSSCLPPASGRSADSRVYGSSIVYTVSPSLKYRSDANTRCGGAADGPDTDVLVTSTPLTRSCAGDPVRLVDRYTGALRGVCSFGPFVPYTRR